jgi:hypothetical protein
MPWGGTGRDAEAEGGGAPDGGSPTGGGSRSRIAAISDACERPSNAPAPGEQFVEHAAERPDVAARVGLAALELLGRHVLERAEQRALGGEPCRRLRERRERRARAPARGGHRAGESEVHELRARAGEHDVRGLQVAMDHARAMRAVERVGDLGAELQRLGGRDAAAREPLLERFALDQLEHEKVRVALAADVEQRTDVRMVEARDRAGLALEARAHVRLRREVLRQHLDGDVAPEPRVARPVDFSHAAGAERRNDFLGSEPGPCLQWHRGTVLRNDGVRRLLSPDRVECPVAPARHAVRVVVRGALLVEVLVVFLGAPERAGLRMYVTTGFPSCFSTCAFEASAAARWLSFRQKIAGW